MRKYLALLLAIAINIFAFSQGPKFYIDNSLTIKNAASQNIPYPFVGGFIAPQFSNIDLNNDGVKDLFVFDKGGNKPLTYIRNTSGSGADWIYAPKYELGFPKMVYWALLADYNGDGKEDIFTAADPGNFGQAIAVYKNISSNGTVQFELVEENLSADIDVEGLPKSPIYWINEDISAIDDVDGDGDIDILTFDASGASITLYGNEAKEKGYPLDSLVFRVYDGCWGGFIESYIDRSITLGTECFSGRYYPKSGGQHTGSTMLLLDIDNDADKDLILGDVSFAQVTLLTNGKTDFHWPYDSMKAYDTIFPRNTVQANIYNFPAPFYADVDNDHVKDLIMAPNVSAGGKNVNQIWYYKNNGTTTNPSFSYVKNNFLQDQTIDFGSGVAPSFIDVDGDADLDMLVAHRGDFTQTYNLADRLELFTNVGDKSNAIFKLDGTGNYLGLIKDSIRDMKPTFGDLNNDSKPDMLIGDGDGHLWYYQNNSSGGLSFTTPVKNFMKIDVGTSAIPQIIDLDEDGLLDLTIGSGAGIINFFKNKGSKSSPQFDSMPTIDTLGGINVKEYYIYYVRDNKGNIIDTTRVYDFTGYAAPYFADLDGNDSLDLVVGSKGGKLWMFTNIKGNVNGDFTEIDTFVFNPLTEHYGTYRPGVRSVPTVAKLTDSSRGKPVIVLGNFRGGLNFLNAVIDDSIPIGPNGLKDIYRDLNVNVFPNPSNGQLNISRSLQQYEGKLDIVMVDMMGRTVYTGNMDAGVSNTTLNISDVQNGIYYLQLTDGKKFQAAKKITVLR